MTTEPGPGLIGPEAERLREKYHQDRQERDAEPVAVEPDEPERPDESTPDLDGFDPVAAAREHWDAPSRTVYPGLIRESDPIHQLLSGGAAEEEALYQMGRKYRRAGWTHVIGRHGWTPVRR